ncbi:hypothetical protein GBA52_022087 [Prunus armeniaca]|nr:hypothetical protein GBA52_022087 [Prunus armeniaca]
MNTRTQIAGLSISILLLVVLFLRFLFEKKDYSSGLPELRGKPAANTRVREALCNGICTPLLKPSSSCSSSEDPLLPWAANLGMETEILRQSHTILEEKELSNNEEGSGVLMKKSSDNEGDMCLHCWKGPATTILAMCSHYTDSRGTTKAEADNLIHVHATALYIHEACLRLLRVRGHHFPSHHGPPQF